LHHPLQLAPQLPHVLLTLRQRLTVIEDTIAENQRQKELVLDVILSEGYDREMLGNRQTKLEETGRALSTEREALMAQLAGHEVADWQLNEIADLTSRLGQALDLAEANYRDRRDLLEQLDVTVALTEKTAIGLHA
jgi:hypothetical protein